MHLVGVVLSRRLYQAVLLLSLVCAAGLAWQMDSVLRVSLLLVPWALWLLVTIERRQGAALNRQLAGTAQFMLASSVLLCADLLWAAG